MTCISTDRYNFRTPGKCDVKKCPPLVGEYYHYVNGSRCASSPCPNTPEVSSSQRCTTKHAAIIAAIAVHTSAIER